MEGYHHIHTAETASHPSKETLVRSFAERIADDERALTTFLAQIEIGRAQTLATAQEAAERFKERPDFANSELLRLHTEAVQAYDEAMEAEAAAIRAHIAKAKTELAGLEGN